MLSVLEQYLGQVCQAANLGHAKEKIEVFRPQTLLAVAANGMKRFAAHHRRGMSDCPGPSRHMRPVDLFV